MALLERLSTDRSLAAFAGQFVPLKLTTDGNAEWSTWARRYPSDGNGIPILYVVRADGEKLYARTGSLSGAALPQMMLATLQQSGRILSDDEAALLEEAVRETDAALEQEDFAAAGRALGQVARVGTLGDLKSFAEPARQADALVAPVVAGARKSIEQAKEQIADPATALEGLLTLVAAQDSFAAFNELKAELATELRTIKRDDALGKLLVQAEALERARGLARAEKALTRKRAIEAYEQVITRFADTPVAKLAQAELESLDPDAAARINQPAKGSPEEPVRIWSDATGQFRVSAVYVQQKQGYVQLKKGDGTLISVPISRLSPEDQDYLKSR